MKAPCTGIILAGGKNLRLPGKKKAFLSIGGKRIIDHIFTLFQELFDEVIIVTNDPLEFMELDAKIVSDISDTRCSLAGIHAGLFYASNPYIFVSACDTPFLSKDLVEYMVNAGEPGKTVIIPETLDGLEPLCAVYSKECLRAIEDNLATKRLKILGFFKKKRTKKIPETLLRKLDPDLKSFFNINTPEDLARAEEMAGEAEREVES